MRPATARGSRGVPSRLYAVVYTGLIVPDSAASSLMELGEGIRELGIPLVITDEQDRVLAQEGPQGTFNSLAFSGLNSPGRSSSSSAYPTQTLV